MAIMRHLDPLILKNGEGVYKVGDKAKDLYIVIKGTIETSF